MNFFVNEIADTTSILAAFTISNKYFRSEVKSYYVRISIMLPKIVEEKTDIIL